MDASADIDALTQESKQGTMMIETVLCGLCYILKLGEFIVHTRFGKFVDASADFDYTNAGERISNRANRNHYSVVCAIETW